MRKGWRNNDSIVRLNNFFKDELDERIREMKQRGYILLDRGTHPNENGYWARMTKGDLE